MLFRSDETEQEGELVEDDFGQKSQSKSSPEDGEGEESEKQSEQSGEDEAENDPKEDGPETGSGQTGSDSTDPMKDFVSHTDKAFRQNESKLHSTKNRKYYYGNIPKMDLDEIVVDYKTLWAKYRVDMATTLTNMGLQHGIKDSIFAPKVKVFQKFREDSKKVVAYLAKEFELKKNAEQMKRASIAKTGELNMSKIYSYTFSEDIFKKMSVIPNGKSHGLVMYIDWSGSMSSNMENTIKQLLNLVMFCKKINIPYEVYAFTNSYGSGERRATMTVKPGEMHFARFHLMNLLSSKMSAAEYAHASTVLLNYCDRSVLKPDWFCLSGTPLNQAVVAAMDMVPAFQKQHKLQIVNTVFLTDGDGEKSLWLKDAKGQDVYITGYGSSGSPNYVVMRDPISKAEVTVEYNCWARTLTTAFIKLLKARTKSNIIGFYILSNREFSGQITHFMDNETSSRKQTDSTIEKLKADFRKDKYMVVKNSGYDEYFLLHDAGMDVEEDAEFVVKGNASTRSFVSAFSKFSNNRKLNRVVLGRFIELIA